MSAPRRSWTLPDRSPRLGVLGAARIAPQALLVPAVGRAEVRAIAARDLVRARGFAELHSIPVAYGSYEELLADPEIDVVYVALPAALHVPWTLAALRAGKHVLCEKPFALDAESARAVVEEAARLGKLVMEAHHSNYHPLIEPFRRALSLIGEISKVEMLFDAAVPEGDIRYQPELGAGVMTDFGCYLVEWLGFVAPGAWQVRGARAVTSPEQVDVAMQAEFEWNDEQKTRVITAEVSCDMRVGRSFEAFIEVRGSEGSVVFRNPLGIEGSFVQLSREGSPDEVWHAEGVTTYARQLDALVSALRTGVAPITSGSHIVETQVLLDQVYRAAGLLTRGELAARAPISG